MKHGVIYLFVLMDAQSKTALGRGERFFEPLGGKVASLNLKRFSFSSRVNTLTLPDEGYLLNRRDGFLRFATHYEPKQSHTVTPSDSKRSGKSISFWGVGGWICFSDLLPPFLIL